MTRAARCATTALTAGCIRSGKRDEGSRPKRRQCSAIPFNRCRDWIIFLSSGRVMEAGVYPCCQGICQLEHDLRIRMAGTLPDVKRVIGVVEQSQCCPRAHLLHDRLHQDEIGQFIACSLKEETGHLDVEQMVAPFDGGPASRCGAPGDS